MLGFLSAFHFVALSFLALIPFVLLLERQDAWRRRADAWSRWRSTIAH